jgi:hypothetical protein
MLENSDDRAIDMLEKAVAKAKLSIEKNLTFRPFLMTLNMEGVLKSIENREPSDEYSYARLEESIADRAIEDKLEFIILAMSDYMPERYSDGKPKKAIRLHFEERSQLSKVVSARYLYVPYTIHRVVDEEGYHVELGIPIPVGFPAEYLRE